jgi:hypothetical protein
LTSSSMEAALDLHSDMKSLAPADKSKSCRPHFPAIAIKINPGSSSSELFLDVDLT